MEPFLSSLPLLACTFAVFGTAFSAGNCLEAFFCFYPVLFEVAEYAVVLDGGGVFAVDFCLCCLVHSPKSSSYNIVTVPIKVTKL